MTDDLRARRDAVIREHMRSENEHEFDSTIGTFHAPKYELVPTGHVIEGEEAVRTYYRASRELVPDQRNELIALHHTDDAAIVEFWLRGTYQGDPDDAPPAGRTFVCRMCAIFDFATILRQLGVAHDPLSLRGRIATVVNHPLTVGTAVLRSRLRKS